MVEIYRLQGRKDTLEEIISLPNEFASYLKQVSEGKMNRVSSLTH